VDLDAKSLSFARRGGGNLVKTFRLGEFEEALVRAGGWVEYADAKY
jgi:3-isopropylmalate/(R)-2-methylmalate dehydratase small subunit